MKPFKVFVLLSFLASLLSFLFPYFSKAKVTLDTEILRPTVFVRGELLELNGVGTYERLFFPIYKVFLYLRSPTNTAESILKSTEPKFAQMIFLRDLSSTRIRNSWTAEFKRQCPPYCDELRERFDSLVGRVPDMKKGEGFDFAFLPESLIISKTGHNLGPSSNYNLEVPGADFAELQLKIWLGENPPSQKFKRGLLGLQ